MTRSWGEFWHHLGPSIILGAASITLAVVISIGVILINNANTNAKNTAKDAARAAADNAVATALWSRYDADIAGCHRGDNVRTVLHELLVATEKARREPPLEPGDIATAKTLSELDSRIWPLKECTDIITRPNVPRPTKP
jgi:hypothetical protein